MSTKLPLLTIPQAEQKMREGDSMLYVLNTSNPRGNINMTIDSGNGSRQTITVPITDIPVDLSIQAVKRFILESPEFRRTHARGFVKIVDSAASEQLFATNEKARTKQAKLYQSLDLVPMSDMEIVQSTASEEVKNKMPVGNQVDPFVANLVLRSSAGQEDPDTLVQELSARTDIITVPDLQYIVSNSQLSELKEAAAELIALKQ